MFFTSNSIKVNTIYLFVLCSLYTSSWSYGQLCGCIDPPDCSPCEGSLASITFRYNGNPHPNNRYRVEDDEGVLASGFITGDITVNSRVAGQPFIDDEIEIFVGRGDDFEDEIDIETTCDEVKVGKEFDDRITIVAAVSVASGPICCNPHDTFVCVSPPDCAPCQGSLTSITFRYNGSSHPNNRYRVEDDDGVLASGFITGDITVQSRVPGQPFEGNELEIFVGRGDDFEDDIEVETTCNKIRLGKGYEDDIITIISAVSAISGPLCCEIEDLDDIPPEIINCPASIELVADEDCKATYNWPEPTVTDNCSNVIFLEKPEFNSGTFPVGETLIRYVASDASGNEAICQFTITVADDREPVFMNCPSNIEVLLDSIVEWQEPTVTNGCGVTSLEGNFQPGNVFPVGKTEVVYTFNQNGENVIACSFIVSVIMNEIDLDIPKLLTLNNDGINDEWRLAGIEEWLNNEVIIVDRWGGEVYKYQDIIMQIKYGEVKIKRVIWFPQVPITTSLKPILVRE